MKIHILFITILFALYGCKMQKGLNHQISITSQSCEYISNPLGIDIQNPRLSWQIIDSTYGQKQTAYQILVSTSIEMINANKGDILNTGKVMSEQSNQVKLDGLELKSKTRYFWKVKIWDQDGNVSKFSDAVWFETAFLSASEWEAKWIKGPLSYDWQHLNQTRKEMDPPFEEDISTPYLMQRFEIEKEIESARVYVCGLGFYELHVNKERVGDKLLDPTFTKYDKRVLYSTYDVTPQLHKGKNAIGILLGNGWYNSATRGVWGFDKAPWRNKPEVKCQLEITFRDGTKQVIATNEDWKAMPSPYVFTSIRQGTIFDESLEFEGWDDPLVDIDTCFDVILSNGPTGVLRTQMIEPVRVMKKIKPVSIKKVDSDTYVIDMGQNMVGKTRLKAKVDSGQEISLTHSERIFDDGNIDMDKIWGLSRTRHFQKDVYKMCKPGEKELESKFTYHGFQYVEIKGLGYKPSLADLEGLVMHTSFEKAGTFECSNDLFNKIQNNTEWSYIGNFMGYPTDCPHREKNGWTGDAHLACETGLFNFAPQAAYTKWMNDFKDEQRKTGELPGIVPTCGWGYYWGNGPAWDNAYILIPWNMYLFNGDITILAEHYDNMKLYVNYLETNSDDLILNFGLGDWVPAKTKTPFNVTSTAYFYKDAVLLSKMATLLGNENDAQYFKALAGKIKEAFNKAFYDAETGHYSIGSQTAQSCAIYQGITDESNNDKVFEQLVNKVIEADNHLDCGILGTKYLLHALSDNGRTDLAYEICNQKDYPSWGLWIEQGATTLWENWDGKYSQNHIMFGDISAWFYQNLAGIKPMEEFPGFKKFKVEPWLEGEMEWVKADYESPYGSIKVHWEKTNEGVRLNIDVPVNTEAFVTLPCKNSKGISIADRNQNLISDPPQIEISEEVGTFELGSGSYILTLR